MEDWTGKVGRKQGRKTLLNVGGQRGKKECVENEAKEGRNDREKKC